MKPQHLILAAAVAVIIGLIVYLEPQKIKSPQVKEGSSTISPPLESMQAKEKAQQGFPRAIEISSPDGFINTDGITIASLLGKKVILIDFWTYSCINCQRTTPYLNAWYEKYKDQGLEIIGLHTPEFDFEKKYDNVAKAVRKFGIHYPVVLDNDYSTWYAYENNYWPRKYLIDIDGFIVYDHIGEGGYEETERRIQAALAERVTALGEQGAIATDIARPQSADAPKGRSPEVYFGAQRNTLLANGEPAIGGGAYSVPETIELNKLYLGGTWYLHEEFAENTGLASIVFRYTAEDAHIVAGVYEGVHAPNGIRVKVLLDGKPVGDRAGTDVDSDGFVTVKEEGLYNLVRDTEGVGTHTLELQVENSGLKAFTFTFG